MLPNLLFEQQGEWKMRDPKCLINRTEAYPSTECRTPEISAQSSCWLTASCTTAVRQSWISIWRHYKQTLHLISTNSQEAICIKSSMQSHFSTIWLLTQIWLSHRRKLQTNPIGLPSSESPRTWVEKMLTCLKMSGTGCPEWTIDVSFQRPQPGRSTSNY